MRNYASKFNTISFPVSMVRAAAMDAGFTACATFVKAQQEIAMPSHRSLKVIHAEALQAQRVAESLASALKGVR
jgi:hypothetical protein